MESIITLTAVTEHCQRKCHGWEASMHEWQKKSPHDFSHSGIYKYIVMEEWESGIGLSCYHEIWFRIDPKSAEWIEISKPAHFIGIHTFAFNA